MKYSSLVCVFTIRQPSWCHKGHEAGNTARRGCVSQCAMVSQYNNCCHRGTAHVARCVSVQCAFCSSCYKEASMHNGVSASAYQLELELSHAVHAVLGRKEHNVLFNDALIIVMVIWCQT